VPPEELTRPTIYSGMKAQVGFHLHSNHISNRLLTTAGPTPEDALSMNQMLDVWCDTLPPYFRLTAQDHYTEQWHLFARFKLWWRFWNLKIILFRQLLLRRAIEHSGQPSARAPNLVNDKCRDIGVDAAHATIISINDFLEQADITRVTSWYSLYATLLCTNWYCSNVAKNHPRYFLFHASLVVALAIIGDAESGEVSKWQADIAIVRNILRNVLVTNTLAARCADILDQILPFDTANPSATFSQNFDFATMDFSVWPAEQGDMFASLGFPEGSSGM
jgi:transcriptional regulatory protein GAL4